jgi:hypothetical protein
LFPVGIAIIIIIFSSTGYFFFMLLMTRTLYNAPIPYLGKVIEILHIEESESLFI